MKKSIFIIFALVLFVFNGNAQTAGGVILSNYTLCGTVSIFNMTPPSFSPPLYSWIVIRNLSKYYQNSAESFVLSNQTGANLNIANINSGIPVIIPSFGAALMSNYDSLIFIRLAKNLSTGITYPSNPVTIYLFDIIPGEITGTETLCTGTTPSINNSTSDATMSVSTTSCKLAYQWMNIENGLYNEISGATSETYQSAALISTTRLARKAFTYPYSCYTYSNTITINVMNCGTFSTNITGTTSIGPNQTATYSVPATVGMQYVWTVTGGAITSGQGTNIITVIWDGGGSANLRTTVADYSVSVVETDAKPASKTTTQAITMTTTGINNSFCSTGISVFPNPIKNQFTIAMPTTNTDVNYTVYSASGVQMQVGSFNATASGNTITTHLPAGMYQLVLSYDGVFTSTRLAVIE